MAFSESLKTFVAIYTVSFLFLVLPVVSSIALIGMFFTSLWPLPVIYFTWVFVIDKNTPFIGGRPFPSSKNLNIWKLCASYFKSKIIKEADLDPKKNYIFACHPHAMFGLATGINLLGNGAEFNSLFPGILLHGTTPTLGFKFPIWRELLLSLGCCAVSRESIFHICSQKSGGHAVTILVGGAHAAADSTPERVTLCLKNRKGFIRMALMTGADLVPVYNFGECESFFQASNSSGWLVRRLQRMFKSIMTLSPLLLHGIGLTLILRKAKLTTAVGMPITIPLIQNPDAEDMNKYHKLYVEELQKLFDKHKAAHSNYPDQILEII